MAQSVLAVQHRLVPMYRESASEPDNSAFPLPGAPAMRAPMSQRRTTRFAVRSAILITGPASAWAR